MRGLRFRAAAAMVCVARIMLTIQTNTMSNSMALVHLIAAARPNFMKIAPLYHALAQTDWCDVRIVHTGQHYDQNMSDAFFADLAIPKPHYHLEVGSGTHAQQTGGVMIAYEQIAMQQRPDWLVVVGDVNSTAACALVGAKLWIPVAHLEAGLRSRDRKMPEEINRLVTDSIADLLWTPSADADENLLAEGIAPSKIEMVGNIMIDSFELMRDRIENNETMKRLGLNHGEYAVVTMHRPSNVDNAEILAQIVAQLQQVARHIQLVFPVHPRTRKQLEKFGYWTQLQGNSSVRLLDPLGYIEFMNLVVHARMAITDSGGIQEETTYLDIPCLTLRENTERPVTVSSGTNELIQPEQLLQSVETVLSGDWKQATRIPYWDGQTAGRVADSIQRHL